MLSNKAGGYFNQYEYRRKCPAVCTGIQMIGLGTLINTAGIVCGGIVGHFFGKYLSDRHQDTLNITCGVSVLLIGITGVMEGMMQIENGTLTSGRSMFVVICLALGALIGETINIDGRFERFGGWLKIKPAPWEKGACSLQFPSFSQRVALLCSQDLSSRS